MYPTDSQIQEFESLSQPLSNLSCLSNPSSTLYKRNSDFSSPVHFSSCPFTDTFDQVTNPSQFGLLPK